MNILKRAIQLLSIISYFLLGIYFLIMIPMLIGYQPLVVLSGSMEPTFKVGSIIYYHKVEENELKIGDIITYKLDDTVVSHRIFNIENNDYQTKGDANSSVDYKKISYSDILGRDLDFYIPFLGF